MKRTLTVFIGLVFAAMAVLDCAGQDVKFPEPEGLVSDYAGILSEKVKTQITNLLHIVEKKTTAEISVVTVRTTAPLGIDLYAVELFQEWGIGKEGEDNGVLLLVASDERRVRIEVGFGLEDAITDAQSKMIIDSIMVPQFREGDFDMGIAGGVVMLAKLIKDKYGVDLDFKAEDLPQAPQPVSRRSPLSVLVTLLFFMLIFGFRLGPLLFVMGGHGGGYWSGGGRGSFGGGFGGFGGGMSGGGGASGSW